MNTNRRYAVAALIAAGLRCLTRQQIFAEALSCPEALTGSQGLCPRTDTTH